MATPARNTYLEPSASSLTSPCLWLSLSFSPPRPQTLCWHRLSQPGTLPAPPQANSTQREPGDAIRVLGATSPAHLDNARPLYPTPPSPLASSCVPPPSSCSSATQSGLKADNLNPSPASLPAFPSQARLISSSQPLLSVPPQCSRAARAVWKPGCELGKTGLGTAFSTHILSTILARDRRPVSQVSQRPAAAVTTFVRLLSLQLSSVRPTATTPSARAPARAPVRLSLASPNAPLAALKAVSVTITSCSLRVCAFLPTTAAAPTMANTCR